MVAGGLVLSVPHLGNHFLRHFFFISFLLFFHSFGHNNGFHQSMFIINCIAIRLLIAASRFEPNTQTIFTLHHRIRHIQCGQIPTNWIEFIIEMRRKWMNTWQRDCVAHPALYPKIRMNSFFHVFFFLLGLRPPSFPLIHHSSFHYILSFCRFLCD